MRLRTWGMPIALGLAITGCQPAGLAAPTAAGFRVQDQPSPLTESWRQRLAGKKLTTIGGYSSGGYTYQNEAALCSNGTFQYQASFDLSIDTGGYSGFGADRDGAQGTWRMIEYQGQPVFEARLADGSVQHFVLSDDGGKTFFNGTRVYVTPQAACP